MEQSVDVGGALLQLVLLSSLEVDQQRVCVVRVAVVRQAV
jgi:hypothetical protein